MKKFIVIVASILLITTVAGCGGGGGSPITDLGQVRAKLAKAGFSCPKPPAPYKKSENEFSLGAADPTTEVECTSDGVTLTASQWKDAATAKATMTVLLSVACGFGAPEISVVDGGSWILYADSTDDEGNTTPAKERAALAKAGTAFGIEPETHKCKDSSSETTEDSVEESSAPTTTVATRGDRAKPLAVGDAAKVGDYQVTVDSITPNATSQVQAANEYNEPPAKGQYAMVTFTAVYNGTDEGSPSMDLSVVLSGSDKVQYPNYDCGAVVQTDDSTIEPGGTLEVSMCIDAPAEAITGGLIFVESTASFDDTDRVYWKVP